MKMAEHWQRFVASGSSDYFKMLNRWGKQNYMKITMNHKLNSRGYSGKAPR
jgi:hypothetical protein